MHVSIGGGLRKAAETAERLGCETIQIFASSPNMWRFSTLDVETAVFFKSRIAELDIAPLVIHTAYLVNLAASEQTVYEKSVDSLRLSAERTKDLGGEYVVTHIGSHKGAGLDFGVTRIANAVRKVLDTVPEIVILLEGSAGSGSNIGGTFEELATIFAKLGETFGRVGFCLDTAHLYGAGYDIASEPGLEKTIEDFDRLIGLKNLKLWHFNDTKVELGSKRDRHWHIGEGLIGLDGFGRIVNHPKLKHLPAILETPKEDGSDLRNLRRLRDLRQNE